MRIRRTLALTALSLALMTEVAGAAPAPRVGNVAGSIARLFGALFEKDDPSASVLTTAPVDGAQSSNYGNRRDPFNRRRRRHKGIDFVAARGSIVRAAGHGVVVSARRAGGYGRLIVIDHGYGVRTRYAHLERFAVAPGDLVLAGSEIGAVGSSGRATGPHLHFEVRVANDAVAPTVYLDTRVQ